MSGIDTYLDRVCADLRANPAEVEDLRRELRLHLEDLMEEYGAEGLSRPEAAERAIARLGEADELSRHLAFVRHGESPWVRRLKGVVLGGLLGTVCSLPFHATGGSAAWDLLLGGLSGACLGLLSLTRARLAVGLVMGSLTWFSARAGALSATDAASASLLAGFPSLLVALVAGGVFGIAVAGGAAALLSLLSPSGPRAA